MVEHLDIIIYLRTFPDNSVTGIANFFCDKAKEEVMATLREMVADNVIEIDCGIVFLIE